MRRASGVLAGGVPSTMNRLEKSSLPNTMPTIGMIRSLTRESTILPKAPPMITPTARSITLPFTANSRNSLIIDIVFSPHEPATAIAAVLIFCFVRLERLPASAGPRRYGLGPVHTMALDRGFAALAGANPHDLLHRRHENLAVADLARACRLDDGLDRAFDIAIGDDELDLDLG